MQRWKRVLPAGRVGAGLFGAVLCGLCSVGCGSGEQVRSDAPPLPPPAARKDPPPAPAAPPQAPFQPDAGTVSPAQDQAIRAVHAAYQKAWAAKDAEGLKACVTKRKVKGLDEPAAKMVIDLGEQGRPSDVAITKIALTNETTAEVTMSGKQGATPLLGAIRMKFENGAWKIDNEDWKPQ